MWSEPVLIVRSVYLSIRCQRYMRSTCQPHSHTSSSMTSSEVCDLVGGDSLKDPPVPIPNTEVKLQGADGTAGETRWESRSPPATPSSLRGTPPVELCSRGRFLLWTVAVRSRCTAPLPRLAWINGQACALRAVRDRSEGRKSPCRKPVVPITCRLRHPSDRVATLRSASVRGARRCEAQMVHLD